MSISSSLDLLQLLCIHVLFIFLGTELVHLSSDVQRQYTENQRKKMRAPGCKAEEEVPVQGKF